IPAAEQPVPAAKPPKAKKVKAPSAEPPARLPREVQALQREVRSAEVGKDPTVIAYLDLIEHNQATPHQIAAFGNFLAESGLTDAALGYYGLAIDRLPADPLLWVNVGTLHRQLGETASARSAFIEALSLDPNNALAHYNLGAVLDQTGNYDAALEEYKLALALDPKLADPAYNPQAVNNARLLAVQMLLYKERAGSAGLSLVEIPEGAIQEETAEPEPEESEPAPEQP
ncbi:MAG TPA: tetratricopeptide repeat protein, partial [Candidatus Polarisedimenticolaceae bacterium]|nr:tetratricopeptide repeat protein [Candidatus Polarisedimenticolaceae bacterium]